MVIGYLTSLYARAADTFIRDEVLELRRRGHAVDTFSIRGPERVEVVSEVVRREQESTDYILGKGVVRLILAFLALCVRQPGRMLSAARLAWETCPAGLRGIVWQLAYLVEASYLARRLRSRRIEHLHNHLGQNSATVAMLAGRITGIPYSLTIHGPPEFHDPIRITLREKIENSAFTVCISSFGRSQCMMWTSPDVWTRLHVIRCGLDESFLTAHRTPVPDALRFVSVGRLSEQKGQLLLVEAVARLREEGIRCEVTLVGDGPLRQTLEDAAKRHGLEDSIRFAGWKSSQDVRAELLRSRALVLPSFAEGLPVAIMEAMALGRPVISTYVAGIPELVENGVSGWLVPAGSLVSLVEAIREAATRPVDQLERMGRAGAERVQRAHNLRASVDELERLMLRGTATE
jgi:glycosyltransferase involved in cell wall biosynthesis